ELPRPEGRPGQPPPRLFATPGGAAARAGGDARREHYVMVANREGKIIEGWTQWDKLWDGSRGPHHIKINPYDPEKHVWIIDDDLQQILEFTNDGKQLVKTIGERLVKGTDGNHFGRPTLPGCRTARSLSPTATSTPACSSTTRTANFS